MKERIALVTGSSRGLGRVLALSLSRVCSGVALHYRRDRASALRLMQEIKSKGKMASCFKADLTRKKGALELIERVEKKFGRIDILVNNFGPLLVKPWEELTSEEWDFILKANLMSSFHLIKASLPGMRKRKWGRIINLGYSRVEQLASFPTITPYAISKTGLLILTRTVAAGVASEGITVNMVSPGLLEGGILPQDSFIPCGRMGRFEDVAHAVLFLASEEAGYVTGVNLIVSGGWKL